MTKKHRPDNSICRNKKAGFKYEILDKLECGIALTGSEVKSLRDSKASLDEAYARIDSGELWLIGFHISHYAFDTSTAYDPTRKRKLLVHSQQLRRLKAKVDLKGLTIVPLRAYFNERGIAKIEIALARGKRTADKRQSTKDREQKRDIARYASRHR